MTTHDPLSPLALCAVPEVNTKFIQYRNVLYGTHSWSMSLDDAGDELVAAVRDAVLAAHTQTLVGMTELEVDEKMARLVHGGEYNETWNDLSDGEKEWYRGRAKAVLSAERARLVALTPDEVVEAAAKAMYENQYAALGGRWELNETKEVWYAYVRAALPILLAPVIAKREAAERERDEARKDEARTNLRLGAYRNKVDAAEAERDRMREALNGLLGVISTDDLIPESVSYMRQARAALEGK